jgi:uncharacterized repeat protein (TIGR03803 family)
LSGGGTIFRSDLSGNTVAIYRFPGHDNYINAELLEAPDGNLYGTAVNYGDFGVGSVFRMDKTGNNVAVVHSFGSTPGEGTYPAGGLLLAPDGAFYGFTYSGILFKMTADGTVTTVGPPLPGWGLTLEPGGTIIGPTYGGGTGSGFLYRISPPDTGFDEFYDYGAPPVPTYPASQLAQTADGTMWGTALAGFSNQGTIYRLSGGPMLVHEFSGAVDGATPGNLYASSDGSLYGVTADQGPGGQGTVFKLDAGGAFMTLHSFSGPDGAEPGGGLMQATDGNFYGTTAFGGANGGGTLYRITSSGTHTKLHDFQANAVPEQPRAASSRPRTECSTSRLSQPSARSTRATSTETSPSSTSSAGTRAALPTESSRRTTETSTAPAATTAEISPSETSGATGFRPIPFSTTSRATDEPWARSPREATGASTGPRRETWWAARAACGPWTSRARTSPGSARWRATTAIRRRRLSCERRTRCSTGRHRAAAPPASGSSSASTFRTRPRR